MTGGSKPGRAYTGSRRSKITDPEARAALAGRLAERYDQGETIRALAADIEASYGFVHKLLTEHRTTMRPSGRQQGSGRAYATSRPRTTEGMEDAYGRPSDDRSPA